MADEGLKVVASYVELDKRKDELEAELKEVKKKMADLESGLIEYFQENELQRLVLNGRTVFVHSQVWASLHDTYEGVKVLKKHGFGDLVKESAHSQRLSAWVRELLEEVKDDAKSGNLAEQLPIPKELRETLKLSEKVSLRVRKG